MDNCALNSGIQDNSRNPLEGELRNVPDNRKNCRGTSPTIQTLDVQRSLVRQFITARL